MNRFFMKPGFAGTILCASSAVFISPGCINTEKATPPNLVVIIADDAAWNDIGAYGNPGVRTPNIDRMAQEGMLFTNAFVTTSSCSPSRASILTGLYPHSTGAPELHMPLPSDKKLFVGALQEAGYWTAAVGKWHIGPKRPEFDTIVEPRDPSGAIDWVPVLQSRPKDKPFFAWLAAVDPHRPYQEGTIDRPTRPEEVIVPPFLPDNEFTRKDLALYYDEITRLDSFVGQVMQELERQGIANNTVVLFMTDNGRPFPRCKTRMIDDGLKTPFIVRWPAKVKPGTICHSLVSSVDIAPTFCELANAEPLGQFQGVSFLPLLANHEAEVRNHVIGEHNWHDYQAHERSVRTKEFLYIRNAFPELTASPPADAVNSITYREMVRLFQEGKLDGLLLDCFIAPRQPEELFAIETDPYQQFNLAENPAYFDKLEEMRKRLNHWAETTGDRVPGTPTPDMFDRITGKKLMDVNEYRKTQKP